MKTKKNEYNIQNHSKVLKRFSKLLAFIALSIIALRYNSLRLL